MKIYENRKHLTEYAKGHVLLIAADQYIYKQNYLYKESTTYNVATEYDTYGKHD
jgi:hypothetical protein